MSSNFEHDHEENEDYGKKFRPDREIYVVKKDGSKELFNVQKVISAVGKSAYRALTKFTKEEKEQILTRLRPGAVLGFPGHVMIYLGKTGQDYYVISQTGHFYQKTDTGFEKVTVNSCVVNSLSVYRKNEKTWLNSLTYCLLYDF